MDFPFPLQIDFDNQSWHSMPVLDCGKSLRIHLMTEQPGGRRTAAVPLKA